MHACVLYGGRLVVVDLVVAEREPRCGVVWCSRSSVQAVHAFAVIIAV